MLLNVNNASKVITQIVVVFVKAAPQIVLFAKIHLIAYNVELAFILILILAQHAQLNASDAIILVYVLIVLIGLITMQELVQIALHYV